MHRYTRRIFFRAFGAAALSVGLGFSLANSPVQAQSGRVVDTVFGQVEVPAQPERIVVLDEGALDTALSVGVQPVAALASRGGTDVANYLQEYVVEPIEIVGTVREPNLEAIFRLRPDLILASGETNEALYGKLSRIAPTVVPDSTDTFRDWHTNVRLFANAMGKADELEEKLRNIDEQLDSLKEQWAEPQTVSIVRWNPQGPILMSGQLFTGQLVRAAGLETIELANDLGQRPHSDTLSLENLQQVDADWLLLASLTDDGEKALVDAQQQSVFKRLQAVQNDQVKVVDGQVWSSGYGPLAAEVIIQDLGQLASQE